MVLLYRKHGKLEIYHFGLILTKKPYTRNFPAALFLLFYSHFYTNSKKWEKKDLYCGQAFCLYTRSS